MSLFYASSSSTTTLDRAATVLRAVLLTCLLLRVLYLRIDGCGGMAAAVCGGGAHCASTGGFVFANTGGGGAHCAGIGGFVFASTGTGTDGFAFANA